MEYSETGRGLNSLLGFRGLLVKPLQGFLFVIVEGLNFVGHISTSLKSFFILGIKCLCIFVRILIRMWGLKI